MNEPIGIVNHVLPRSFVDGPGNRAVVFLQGCNFRCLYCHNPYTINTCIHCGLCVESCPAGALTLENGRVLWKQELCVECDTCIRTCPHSSSPRTQTYSPQALWEEIERIGPFITGVSVSGGEPSLQVPFLARFFKLVKQNSQLTTLIETNGFAGPQAYTELLPWLDMALVDLKCSDPRKHLELTSRPLDSVLESIRFFAANGKLRAVQQVIAPAFTDQQEDMQRTAGILAGIDPDIRLRLLRFRPHGTSGLATDWQSPGDECMDALVQCAHTSGLRSVERSL
ncbi:MAG: pyruvate formate lyase activating enzyme [Chloroflexota bacterium]|nr:pyruvate formate lyase activating enzyme [Chloroflexota bacterium]